MPTIPERLTVRLHPHDRDALSAVASAVAVPHRPAPTVIDTIRAAIAFAAAHMPKAATVAPNVPQ